MSAKTGSQAGRAKTVVVVLALACAALLAADLAYHKHGHYHEEELFGFFPALGFGACVVLALAARALGLLTRRGADAYARHAGADEQEQG